MGDQRTKGALCDRKRCLSIVYVTSKPLETKLKLLYGNIVVSHIRFHWLRNMWPRYKTHSRRARFVTALLWASSSGMWLYILICIGFRKGRLYLRSVKERNAGSPGGTRTIASHLSHHQIRGPSTTRLAVITNSVLADTVYVTPPQQYLQVCNVLR